MTNQIFVRIFYILLVVTLCLLFNTLFTLHLSVIKTYKNRFIPVNNSIFNEDKHERKSETVTKNGFGNAFDNYLIDTIGCKISAFNVSDIKLNIYRSPLICPGPPRLTVVIGTVLYVNQSIKAVYYLNKIKHCKKWNIKRSNNDNDIVFENPIVFDNQTKLDAQFCMIECVGFNNSVLYTDFHSRIICDEYVLKKLKYQSGKIAEDMPLSVLLIGIDSTSRNSFSRQMPRLKKFLLETLNAYSFPGFTRVGINTLPNIIPMLTGKHLSESKWHYDMSFDSVDFIWKKYSSKSAITLLAEDRPRTGAFNFHRRGFLKPPTDFYIRPLTLAMAKKKSHKEFCVGPVTETEHILHYTKQFLKRYGSSFYFAFTYFTDWSHDDLNGAARWEDKLLDTFQWLHQSKILNNTLLFFFGDHGFRIGGFRKTVPGSHEVNLPFSFLIVPEWMKIKYKSNINSLVANQKRLLTFFDVHATLYENLNRGAGMMTSKRSISLMSPIPSNRTCNDAEIPAEFCECFSQRKQVSIKDVDVIKAARAVVKSLNKRLEREKAKQCTSLKLKKIIRAFKYRTRYSVVLMVSPSHGMFKSLVEYSYKTFQTLGNILRINKYGNQSHCVKNPDLKPICFCATTLISI